MLHVEPGRKGNHRARQRHAVLAQLQHRGDGQVAARRVAAGDDVGCFEATRQQFFVDSRRILDLGRIRMLGRPAVVDHHRGRAQMLGQVTGQLAMAGGRAHGKAAAVRVQDDLLGVCAMGQGPDGFHAGEHVRLVGHAFRLERGLMPLVEQAAQVGEGHRGVGGHAVRPGLVQRAQKIRLGGGTHACLLWLW